MKQYRTSVGKLSDDFDIENKVKALQQNAKKLTENGIELPIPKQTFMQKLRREYVHSFDTLDDFNTDMKPAFDEYRAETAHAEKEERKKLKEKKDAEELKQRMQAHKRKEKEEHALEMKRRNEASELLRRQRLAAQMQPQKKKKLENENNNDCGPPM